MNIYLSPSYEEVDTRYPVIYYLHAYNGSYTSWVGIHNATTDDLINQSKVQEMIVVMPDANNKYAGSWYANSSKFKNDSCCINKAKLL